MCEEPLDERAVFFVFGGGLYGGLLAACAHCFLVHYEPCPEDEADTGETDEQSDDTAFTKATAVEGGAQ